MESRPGHSRPSSQGDFVPPSSPGNGRPSPPPPPGRPTVRPFYQKLSRNDMMDGDAEATVDFGHGVFRQRNYNTMTVRPVVGTARVNFGVGRPSPPAGSSFGESGEEQHENGGGSFGSMTSRLYRPRHGNPSTHIGQTRQNSRTVCMEFFTPWDPKLVLGLKRIAVLQESVADVSASLTFRKYFSFNNPVYAATIHIRNESNRFIVYKIIPSNREKLCMTDTQAQGILECGATKAVSIVTHSMIPYKYVDIMREVIDVAFAPVELCNGVTKERIKNPCQCLWDKVTGAALDNFWSHNPPGSDGGGMGMSRIADFQPSDSAYFAEKSEMWAECGPWKLVKSVGRCFQNPTTGWSDGVADFFHCNFDMEKRIGWNCLAGMFPNHMDLDTTQWLAGSNNRNYTPISLKKKVIKFLVLSLGISLGLTFAPKFPFQAPAWKWFIPDSTPQ